MVFDAFDWRTLVDVSVNLIPMAILTVFVGLFLVVAPWGVGLTLATVLQIALLVVPIVGVAIVTYVAARKIEV